MLDYFSTFSFWISTEVQKACDYNHRGSGSAVYIETDGLMADSRDQRDGTNLERQVQVLA